MLTGHCLHEIFALREGKKFERVPDMVVWPSEFLRHYYCQRSLFSFFFFPSHIALLLSILA